MKKITEPFQRVGKTGYWLRWYVDGKPRLKHFNTKKEADHYRHYKYMQLNTEIYTNISIPFDIAKKEYLERYEIEDLSDYSKSQANKIITAFWDKTRPLKTGDISQRHIDYYCKVLKTRVSGWSVNRELRTLRTFFLWLKKRGYTLATFNYPLQKTGQPKAKALTDEQIKSLLIACPHYEWKLRIVLFLCTGLRKNDLYKLPTTAIDIKTGIISTAEQKTGKLYSCPLPDAIIEPLKSFIADRKYLFKVYNQQWLDKQFRLFRPDKTITIQSLRKTFATRIETTSISTQILNHSGTGITRKFYNDLNYIKYIRVNQLPIEQWLS